MIKWIEFIESYTIGKATKTFVVSTKDSHTAIGLIKWYGPWRKYSFFPHPNTVYETQCLKDIVSFIDRLMLERKAEKQDAIQRTL